MKPKSKPPSPSSTFSYEEDEKMWEYIWNKVKFSERCILKAAVRPNQWSFWNPYIEKNGCKRQPRGLATHFRMKMAPNLHAAPMSKRIKAILYFVYSIPVDSSFLPIIRAFAPDIQIDSNRCLTRLIIKSKHEEDTKQKPVLIEEMVLDKSNHVPIKLEEPFVVDKVERVMFAESPMVNDRSQPLLRSVRNQHAQISLDMIAEVRNRTFDRIKDITDSEHVIPLFQKAMDDVIDEILAGSN
ncbi:unnamed protein product [Caenorhabditis sp. 36 PRJEB53466]|nr:unnamed protein product [Caenorhabditis sp. 36 PRJEB53466]